MNASSSDNDNESSSDNNSDHEETHSDSEKQSSDSGSEAEEEQHDLSQYSESNNVLEIGELDESTENIRSADNALSKAILFSELQLYPSPLCHLSVLEGILDIMNLYLKNKLSKNGLQRLIETTCKFLPTNHNLPTSSYQILTFVQSLAPPVPAVKHFYCKSCFHYHGESNVGECAICKVSTNFGHFYIFDVAALLIFFFEHRNLADLMDNEARKRSNRDPKLLTDLKDGSVY
ncbi:uncharacterized protein LOC117640570 [Thrips palmi]|nr:uncharacterized protein LOC117640570 [Thrips palmi]